jgi:hypothetical protein
MIPSSSIEAIFEQQDAAFLLANKTGGAKSMMFIGGYWLEQIKLSHGHKRHKRHR